MKAVPVVDVEFSSSLNNRSGKFFIGRDLLEDQAGLIGAVHFYRQRASTIPVGLHARLLSRALSIELRLRRKFPILQDRLELRPPRPLLHLDPFTVLYSRLEARDIVLCHDIGPVSHPRLFAPQVVRLYERAYHRIVQRAPRMVFVSNASRSAFAERFGALEHMRVVYPNIRAEIDDRPGHVPAGVRKPYLLTVGSVGHRKNQLRTVQAFARSGLAQRGIWYVMCGPREPGAEEVAAAAERTDGVRLLNYVADHELRGLYANAAGFVLLSELEGFGLPVVEAIQRGLVPLVARHSVLEEVAGEAALTADAFDVDQIAQTLRTLVDLAPHERSEKCRSLQASIRRFSRSRFREEWAGLLSGV